MTIPKLMVIVPALNEAEAVGNVVRSVKCVLPDTPVLVIDDHSTDATARVAEEAGADVVRLPLRLGVGGCMRTGYQIAVELGYEYVIRVDGDGQHEAGDIPDVLAALESTGDDVVIGSRFLAPGRWRSTFARAVGIALFRRLLTPVLGKPIHDPTSGFVGMNRRAFEVFSRSLPSVYPEIGTLIMLRRNQFRFHEIPCRMYPRRTGRSSFTVVRSVHYTFQVLLGILLSALRPDFPPEQTDQRGFETK